MGYRPKLKIYNLDFAGTEYEGLQVSVRGMTVGEELELDTKATGDLVIRSLANILQSWNVEDGQGQPVPATFEGVCTQQGPMILAILNAVRQANSGVPDPLPETSPSGGTSPAPPIPMTPVPESESLAS